MNPKYAGHDQLHSFPSWVAEVWHEAYDLGRSPKKLKWLHENQLARQPSKHWAKSGMT